MPRTFAPSRPLPRMVQDWNSALPLAIEFWRRIQADDCISEDFRGIAAAAERVVVSAPTR